jgi:hypothetical protein
MIEMSEETLIWLLSCDTGRSSLTLCSCLYLIPTRHDEYNYPHDPADFGRCKMFLETLAPEDKKTALLNVSKVGKQWKRLVKEWDRLETLYEKNELRYKEMEKIITSYK